MGDRAERARALRREWIGGVLTLVAVVVTVALAVAIPTQGENPHAWGVIGCGLLTAGMCARLTVRNRRLLRHYRGEDLDRAGARSTASWLVAVREDRTAPSGQARAKAAR